MAYITEQDLIARYRIFSSNSMSNVASDTIYYAEREVESALASRFTIPFDGSHPTVKDLCIEACFVRYKRMTDPKNGKALNDMFYERIGRILNGKEPMLTDSGTLSPAAQEADTPWSTNEDYHSVHSMLDAENGLTSIDDDLITDEENERYDG